MKLKNIEQVRSFVEVLDKCKGKVYITSSKGDKIDLKSHLSRYVGIGILLGKNGDEYELWCDKREDETMLVSFLMEHRDIIFA